MPQRTTTYDILISCPSDVDEYVRYIKQAVSKFNNGFGKDNKLSLRTLYWKDDSFAESGGAPQDLLNDQLVANADLNVAVFWKRFGKKTKNYGSGSEEEIENMIKDQKQVFIYFLNKGPAHMSDLDDAELTKIRKFKKRYEGKGIYFEVADEQKLKDKFEHDLEAYFRKKLKKK